MHHPGHCGCPPRVGNRLPDGQHEPHAERWLGEISAVAGALVRGQTITIPPGTLLEFTLMQPVPIPVAN